MGIRNLIYWPESQSCMKCDEGSLVQGSEDCTYVCLIGLNTEMDECLKKERTNK